MPAARQKNFDAYKSTEISTASQGKLIVMMYEGSIRFLKIAMDNLSLKTYDIANNHIIKAQDIITELMLSLNMEEGGEISQNLFNIYAYMKKRLLEGNMSKDRDVLAEVVKLLERLKGAWEEVAAKESAKPENPSSQIRAQGISFSIKG